MRLMLLFIFVMISQTTFADKIMVAADPWCPYTCDSKTNKKGYMIEILQKAVPQHEISYQILSWAKALADTKSQTINAAVGAGDGDKDGMILTTTMGYSQNCFFVKKGSSWKYSGLASLEKLNTLGAVNGYTYNEEVDGFVAKNAKKIDPAPGEDALGINTKKVIAGRTDAFIEDLNVTEAYLKENKITNIESAGCIESVPLYVAFSFKHPKAKKYIEEINAGVDKLRKSGELQKILDNYGVKNFN